jgi:hypothetical protein
MPILASSDEIDLYIILRHISKLQKKKKTGLEVLINTLKKE